MATLPLSGQDLRAAEAETPVPAVGGPHRQQPGRKAHLPTVLLSEFPAVNLNHHRSITPLTLHYGTNGSLTLHYNARTIHLTSSHHTGIAHIISTNSTNTAELGRYTGQTMFT